ncbi:MAG: hypothetical protein MUP82_08360, partial [Candidatus Marinimicrobia bacterium]|nr:hypothetical protein [Candidatus Neomarinimicrobiota bacterium]
MKGSSALIPRINPTRCEDLLPGLGFEEGELEMFFDMNQVSVNQLVERYLQTARSAPYNLNWQTGDDACIADYMLGVFKDNGVEFTKHDIVKDVFESFSQQQAGRRKKSRRSTKKRINKRRRGTRRKH